MDTAFQVDSEGNFVSRNLYARFLLDKLELVVLSELEFNFQLSEIERRSLVRRAIRRAKRKGNLSAAKLRAELHKAAQQYSAAEPTLYTIVTSLSVSPAQTLKRKQVHGCTITFGKLPSRFEAGHETLVEKHWDLGQPEALKWYGAVRITCRALTGQTAVDIGLDAMNFLRGIWNWHRNRFRYRFLRNPMLPENDILLGPFQTCHHEDGTPAVDTLWYEDHALARIPSSPVNVDWKAIMETEEKVRRMVRVSPHRTLLRQAFGRYGQALDSSDAHRSFLRLWSLLELLTAMGRSDRAGKVVRRASFPFGESSERETLWALSDFRNKNVHDAIDSHYTRDRVAQLRHTVEHMLALWLGPLSDLGTADEVGRFLDLSNNKETLQKEIELRRIVLDLL